MIFSFVFVDHTTDLTASRMRPASAVPAMIEALSEQLDGAYSTSWKGAVSCAEGYTFRIASNILDRQPGEVAINLRDTIPEAPDALAYHTVVNGIPDIEVGIDLFSSLVDGQDSVLCGISHEILELLGDPGANAWCDRQNGTHVMDARELCDFVQNTSYRASNGGSVSNFVLPSFFVPGAPGPWDYLGAMKSQYDVSHGYGITVKSPTGETQIGGKQIVGEIRAEHTKRKSHPFSRTSRRGFRAT